MEGFADEAHNKIDQDLMMLENGIRTRDLLRRLAKYKELVSSPSVQHEEFAEQFAERERPHRANVRWHRLDDTSASGTTCDRLGSPERWESGG